MDSTVYSAMYREIRLLLSAKGITLTTVMLSLAFSSVRINKTASTIVSTTDNIEKA